jgi:hypothetical protein
VCETRKDNEAIDREHGGSELAADWVLGFVFLFAPFLSFLSFLCCSCDGCDVLFLLSSKLIEKCDVDI